jgi:hypothetical protein
LFALVVARLILHIGQTKTATTTIQAFLHGNQQRLEDLGVHYLGRPDRARSHRFIYHALQLETYGDLAKLRKIAMERLVSHGVGSPGQAPSEVYEHAWSILAESLSKAERKTAVLSEELLWHLGGFRHERRLPLLHTLRRRLLRNLDPADLMIVVCLRHHADWAESWHNQLVKDTGNQTPVSKFVPYLFREGAFRYAENLADWRSVFPEAEFVVKDFHGHLLAAEQPPGLALLNTCGALQGLSPHDQDLLEHPEPLQEAIHPFVHHWITRHQPPGASLKQYRRAVRRVAERRFGEQRFTILTSELAAKLNDWSQDDPLTEVLGSDGQLLSRIPERQILPRPLPRRVRELCAKAFNLS